MPTGQFKKQPWIIYDTVAAHSFLIGDTSDQGRAQGTQNPALNQNGEMIFFGVGGRDKANTPELTNMDASLLSVGLEIWKLGIEFKFPLMEGIHNTGFDPDLVPGVNGPTKLIESIVNWGIFSLDAGQEEQMAWPLTSIGSAGGLWITDNVSIMNGQNGPPDVDKGMRLPEPIAIERTQVLKAKIRVGPQAHNMIGTWAPAATRANWGVGQPLENYLYYSTPIPPSEDPTEHSLQQNPYAIQVKLWCQRVKREQYGAYDIGPAAPAGT